MITEEYKKLNTQLHKKNDLFGGKGFKRADEVYRELIKPLNLFRVLDYGCGKGTLALALKDKYKYEIENYDPSVPVFSTRPRGVFDGIVCMDVLEHVEPEFTSDVLNDIYNLSVKAYYFNISLSPSNKTLPDGRNAHLVIENQTWWMQALEARKFKLFKVLEREEDAKREELKFFTAIYLH